ncbi:MAG TPA: laminin B domain-containing protein [Phycisphaerales bacterium]|nr:laminin B domain-containing protein [Phycisphaerales bacterium]
MSCRVAALLALAGCSVATSAQQSCELVVKPDPNFNFTAIANTPVLNDILLWDKDGPFGPLPQRILLAGGLTNPGNQTVNHMIVSYDPVAGTWEPVGGGFRPGNGTATAAAVMPNGDVIVTGGFTQIGDTPGGGPLVNANLIARWDGTQWNAMGSGIQPTSGFGVFDMAVTPAGELIIVGAQQGAGGVASRFITKWTGTQWVAMNNGLNIDVNASLARCVAVSANGTVYVGGRLQNMGDIVRWTGTQWESMGAGLGECFNIVIDPFDQQPIAITNFIPGVPSSQQSQLAKWNGSSWQPLGNSLQNANAVTVGADGRVYAKSGIDLRMLDRRTNTWVPVPGAPQLLYERLFAMPDGDLIAVAQSGQQRLHRFGPPADCPLVATNFDTASDFSANWTHRNFTSTWQGPVVDTTPGKLLPSAEAVTRIVNQEPVYYATPAAYRGDKSGAYGGRIRAELSGLQTSCVSVGESPAFFDVRLRGLVGGVEQVLVRRSADFATMRDRRVANIPLTPDGWQVGSMSGPNATAQQLFDALKNFQGFELSVNAPGPLCNTVNFALEDLAIYKQEPITSFNWNVGNYDWRWTGDGDTALFLVQAYNDGERSLMSQDAFQGQWRNYVAPQTMFDGFRNRYGGILSFKMRTSTTVENENFPLVRIEARDVGTLLYFDPNPPGTTLTPYFVPLSASPVDSSGRGWIVENLSPPLTEAFVRRVLDNVTAVKIRAEFSREPDFTWLDDVAISTTFSNPGCDDIDFNNNTVFPEDQDVIDFFNVLAGQECPTCNDIDFNNNTVFPEDQDVIDFFTVLAGGECS